MIQSKIEILESQKKLFKSNPYKIVFRLSYNQISSKQIKLLLNLLTTELELNKQENLKNLRGRPYESFAVNSKYISKEGEEIINIYGDASSPDSDQSKDFCYSLATYFSEYSSAGEVIHTTKNRTSGILSDFEKVLNVEKVCFWIPLSINGFRVGTEHYAKFFLGSMLGAVPSIESRFYIEADRNAAWVLVEKINAKDIFSSPALEKLNNCLEQTNIFKGLLVSLKKQYG